ncbi:MAG: ADP-ribosyltransferase [Methanotrichaceae archaeon]
MIPLEGFTSSTYARDVAYRYASDKASDDDEIAIVEILAPKGTKAAAIENYSQSKQDLEVLINRRANFKVIEARKDGNAMRLIWEVVL